MLTQRLYAFWKDDGFPYCCGGEVMEISSNGHVVIVGYGKGYEFKPFLIVPYKQGIEIESQLRQIENDYTTAKSTLHENYVKMLASVIRIPVKD